MLKITELPTPAGGAALVLEGRLVGPWVDELRRVIGARADGSVLTLDLRRLDFADRQGLALLAGLRRVGVGLDGATDFVRALLGGGDDEHSDSE